MTTATTTESKTSKFAVPCSYSGRWRCTWTGPFQNVREARTVYQDHWKQAHPDAHITVRMIDGEVSAAFNAASAGGESPSQTSPTSLKVSSNGQIHDPAPAGGEASGTAAGAVVELDPAEILPSPYQPRSEASLERGLAELVGGIKANGQQVPVAVRRVGERFQLMYGERRLRAVRFIGGGLKVKAIVREADEVEAVRAAFEENGRRRDLTSVEVARAVDRLLGGEAKLTQAQVAEILGIAQPTVANMRKIVQALPPEAMDMVDQGFVLWSALRPLVPATGGEPLPGGRRSSHRHDEFVMEVLHAALPQVIYVKDTYGRGESLVKTVQTAGDVTKGIAINEEKVQQSLKHNLANSTVWRPLSKEAWELIAYRLGSRSPFAIAKYEAVAPGEVHDFGKGVGVWACNRRRWESVSDKHKGGEPTRKHADSPVRQVDNRPLTNTAAAAVVETHVEKVLPQLAKAAGKTKDEVKATVGEPINLDAMHSYWGNQEILEHRQDGTRRTVYSSGTGDVRLAVPLEDFQKDVADPDECKACPHGGRTFGAKRADGGKVKVIEVCVNKECLSRKLKAAMAAKDKAADAQRATEDRMAGQVIAELTHAGGLMLDRLQRFMLAALVRGGYYVANESKDVVERKNLVPMAEWLAAQLGVKIKDDSRRGLDVNPVLKALAEADSKKVLDLWSKAFVFMARDAGQGRFFHPVATPLFQMALGPAAKIQKPEQA